MSILIEIEIEDADEPGEIVRTARRDRLKLATQLLEAWTAAALEPDHDHVYTALDVLTGRMPLREVRAMLDGRPAEAPTWC